MRCEVCKKRFPIRWGSVYRASEPVTGFCALTNPGKVYDAIDCPHCGCQHLLKERFPPFSVKGGDGDDD